MDKQSDRSRTKISVMRPEIKIPWRSILESRIDRLSLCARYAMASRLTHLELRISGWQKSVK